MDIVDATVMKRFANHLGDRTRTIFSVCAYDYHWKISADGIFSRIHDAFDFLWAAIVQKLFDPLQSRGLREAINLAKWIWEVPDIQDYRIAWRIWSTQIFSRRRAPPSGLNDGHISECLQKKRTQTVGYEFAKVILPNLLSWTEKNGETVVKEGRCLLWDDFKAHME